MVTDHREIAESEDPPDLRRSEHLPERFLDALLHLADLATDGREPSARGVQDRAPAIQAPLDGRDQPREFADALSEAPQARELFADAREPAIDVADGPEGLARLGQLLDLEDAADLRLPHQLADIVQSAERRPQARAHGLDHLGGERLPMMDLARIDARLDLPGRGPTQRTGGPRGDQGADLVEFQEFQRVRVHVESRPEAPHSRSEPYHPEFFGTRDPRTTRGRSWNPSEALHPEVTPLTTRESRARFTPELSHYIARFVPGGP